MCVLRGSNSFEDNSNERWHCYVHGTFFCICIAMQTSAPRCPICTSTQYALLFAPYLRCEHAVKTSRWQHQTAAAQRLLWVRGPLRAITQPQSQFFTHIFLLTGWLVPLKQKQSLKNLGHVEFAESRAKFFSHMSQFSVVVGIQASSPKKSLVIILLFLSFFSLPKFHSTSDCLAEILLRSKIPNNFFIYCHLCFFRYLATYQIDSEKCSNCIFGIRS